MMSLWQVWSKIHMYALGNHNNGWTMCMLKPSIRKTMEPKTSMAGYGNSMMWMTTNNKIRLYWYDVTLNNNKKGLSNWNQYWRHWQTLVMHKDIFEHTNAYIQFPNTWYDTIQYITNHEN